MGGWGGRGETCSSNLFLLLPLVIRWIVFLLLFLGVASVFERNPFTVKHKLLNCGIFCSYCYAEFTGKSFNIGAFKHLLFMDGERWRVKSHCLLNASSPAHHL